MLQTIEIRSNSSLHLQFNEDETDNMWNTVRHINSNKHFQDCLYTYVPSLRLKLKNPFQENVKVQVVVLDIQFEVGKYYPKSWIKSNFFQ